MSLNTVSERSFNIGKDVFDARMPVCEESDRPLSLAAVLVCIVLVAIDLRPGIVSVGPLLPMLRDEFSLTNEQASYLMAVPALLMGVLAFPTPWLAQRFGRDRIVLIALIILTIATAARAFVGSFGLLLVTTAGVGAGIAIAGALVAGFVKQNFPKHGALLMGIYAMSLGLGSTLAAGTVGLISEFSGGWRLGSGIYALPGLTAIAAWLSASYVALNNILFFGFVSWTAPMYRELGLDTVTAGMVLAGFTIGFMLANPIAGMISRNQDRRLVIALFATAGMAGILATAIFPLVMPFVFIPLIAVGVGGSFTLGMTLPLDNASNADEANAWTAFVMGIGYFVGAFGPIIFGTLRDLTGGFDAPVWAFGFVAFLMLVLSPFLKPQKSST